MPTPNTSTQTADLPIGSLSVELRAQPGHGGEPDPYRRTLVFSTGASVRRYDWMRERAYDEVLVISPAAMRLQRLQAGAPLLDSHQSWSLSSQLGVVQNPVIEQGRALCDMQLSRRDDVAGVVQDVADGVIRNVSVGYIRHRIQMVPPETEGGVWRYDVTDWEPLEVSLVPIPADLSAQVRAAPAGAAASSGPADLQPEVRAWPCQFFDLSGVSRQQPEGVTMPGATDPAVQADTPADDGQQRAATAAPQPAAVQAATAAPAAASGAAPAQDGARAADILELCQRHGQPSLAPDLLRRGSTMEEARTAVLDALARTSNAGGHRNVSVQTVQDEGEVQARGIQEALAVRMDPRAQITDNGRRFRHMSLLEMGRDLLRTRGVNTESLSRMELAGAMLRSGGMHTTGDFPLLLANIARQRLRTAYQARPGTYQRWARRAPNAPDFKMVNLLQLSGAPELLQTNEAGEFRYGTMTESGVGYKLATYGRIVSLSRQAIVNDDLRGFDRMLSTFGDSAARLENRVVYDQLLSNLPLGATGDNNPLFHAASHKNLGTGAGSALSLDALRTGRTALRKQTGLQGETLNLTPSTLIVGSDLETTAVRLLAPVLATTQNDVNEFVVGGRSSLDLVVDPLLDAAPASWYLAADPAQIDTVEFCYLDGAEGPVLETQTGFEVDGTAFKCRLDFAAKAVDYRGLYKGAGA